MKTFVVTLQCTLPCELNSGDLLVLGKIAHSSQPYRSFRISYGNSPLNMEYGNEPTIRRTVPSTYQPFDQSSVALCKLLRSQFTSNSNFCTYKINNLHGGGAGLHGVGLRMRNMGCMYTRIMKRQNTEDLHKKYWKHSGCVGSSVADLHQL